MTISRVYLINVESGQPEPAEPWDAITEHQLTDWEGAWMPDLYEALRRLRMEGVKHHLWPQSRHWNWCRKTKAIQGMLAQQGFSIVRNGLTQGMMIVDTTMKRCRIGSQKGKHLVYVEFVENAPRNRRGLFDPPGYRGVGSVLIRAAIALSEDLGFHARIGLHSLPQADGFYARVCGMTDLGTDPSYHNLRYHSESWIIPS